MAVEARDPTPAGRDRDAITARAPARPPAAESARTAIRASRLWGRRGVESYPDGVLGLAEEEAPPDARYEQREAVELAFVVALRLLPARQRTVLILRNVLGVLDQLASLYTPNQPEKALCLSAVPQAVAGRVPSVASRKAPKQAPSRDTRPRRPAMSPAA